jgi:2,5-furandicarboxylate decarboxylase 1
VTSSPKHLGKYLDSIRSRPEECRIVERTINPDGFEVTAILEHLDRRRQYPAVIFEEPLNLYKEPSGFPLVANLWATRERCAEMLGLDRSQAGRELGITYAGMLGAGVPPEIVADAPVQAHVLRGDDADMWRLPVVRHAEMDLGPVLTMANVMRHPSDPGAYNITFIKTFPETGHRGGLTIHGKDMGRMLREWRKRGERVPTISVLGHHPGFWIGSLASTPYGTNEYATVGHFLGEPLRLAPSVTWGSDFLVPADAEMIIEAEIVPGEHTVVDPFGEVSRLYQAQQLGPTIEVTAITHRDGAVMQDVFSGHREHFLLGLIPREGSIYNHLQQRIGGVTAVHLPTSGYGRSIAYVSIEKQSEGQPKRVALETMAYAPQLSIVVVVDHDIDAFNEEDVIWAIQTYVDPRRDVDLIRNVGGKGDRAMENSKILIDATMPTDVVFPSRLRMPSDIMAAVNLDEWLVPANGSANATEVQR